MCKGADDGGFHARDEGVQMTHKGQVLEIRRSDLSGKGLGV